MTGKLTFNVSMTARSQVLLVEDDGEMRKALVGQLLLHEDFETTEAISGAAALGAVGKRPFDIVLLDIGLPDMDGRDVCRLIRRKGIHVPIIMLTGLEGDADEILGLDSGANDYVIKPYKLGVLLARMRAHLRQHEASEDASFVLGPYTFRPSAHLLIDRETSKEVALSEKESAILRFLYRAGEKRSGATHFTAKSGTMRCRSQPTHCRPTYTDYGKKLNSTPPIRKFSYPRPVGIAWFASVLI